MYVYKEKYMAVRTVFTIKLDADIQAQIRAKAKHEERNISVVVERMLREVLRKDDEAPTHEASYARES
jgi:hypothetical protein